MFQAHPWFVDCRLKIVEALDRYYTNAADNNNYRLCLVVMSPLLLRVTIVIYLNRNRVLTISLF